MSILRKAPSQRSTHRPGSLSDDEPIYDSVASDEDYASIGDSHSLKEEKMDRSARNGNDRVRRWRRLLNNHFIILLHNQLHHLVGCECLSLGTVSGTNILQQVFAIRPHLLSLP